MEEFKKILYRACGDIGLTLTDHETDLFMRYYEELILWNKKMSLVSIKSPLDIPKHVIDSLTVTKCIANERSRLLDIGTGAGLPGIPLKITMDSLRVTLLDSSRKKVSFLKNIVRKLELTNVSVVNGRAEVLTAEEHFKDSFDVVISRAAFKMPVLLTLGEAFLSDGGILIAMKGKNADAELRDAADVVRKKGLALIDRHEITLPITGESRKILCFNRRWQHTDKQDLQSGKRGAVSNYRF